MDFLEKIGKCASVMYEMFAIDNKEEQTPEDKARHSDLLRESIVHLSELKRHKNIEVSSNDVITALVKFCGRATTERKPDIQPTVTPVVETKPPVQPVLPYESKYSYIDHALYFPDRECSLYHKYCARVLDCTTEDELAELNGTYLKMAAFLDDSDYAKHLENIERSKTPQ